MNKATDITFSRRICVVGIGDAGCNATNRMAAGWADGPKTAIINTDARTLDQPAAAVAVQIGARLTKGMGTGSEANIGRVAAEEDREAIRALFTDADLVFLVVGLGGGTGSGAAPVVARLAREAGAMVLAIATQPFSFEGESRRALAAHGLDALRGECDATIVIPNQRLFELARNEATAEDAFRTADAAIGDCIFSIWNLLVRKGLINLDFADLQNVIRNSGGASVFGYGEASGADKARKAVSAAINSPLLEHGKAVAGSQSLLVSILGGPDLALSEIETVMNAAVEAAPKNASVTMGAVSRPDWTGRISVTIIASEQCQQPAEEESPAAETPEAAAADPAGVKHKRRSRVTQTRLNLDPASKGRFKDVEPTRVGGEDLDIPTFARRGLVIDR